MSESNEQSDATQQGAGSIQDDTERRVEATAAAKRKAQELGVDLASVEGTGPGGRISATDVENAHRRTDSTAEPVETLQSGGSPLSTTTPRPDATTPSLDDIQRQYSVLKATLAGPKDGILPLKITKEDGSLEDPITADTFPDNPSNFFAPEPPIVQWVLPRPQRRVPATLPGTNQPCRGEECLLTDTVTPTP
jgi:hypothetical protein